jgi:hypothetical protein
VYILLTLAPKKKGGGAPSDHPHLPPGYVTVVLSQLYRIRNVTPSFKFLCAVILHYITSPPLRLRFPRSLARFSDNFYVCIICIGSIRAYVPPNSVYQGT